MRLSTPDARVLVREAQAGDRESFAALYRLYHAALFRMARFHVGTDPDDVVAETFVRAWRALPRYRETGAPFVAWLYGIARHVVSDERERRRRVEPVAELPEGSVEPADDDRLALAAAMRRLPAEQRQVVELKFMVGLSNTEVATALDRSVGAVNALQWRALRALRRLLEEDA